MISPERGLRTYPHGEVEPKWQSAWETAALFHSEPSAQKPSWTVIELPPFANGTLHLGHVRNYTIGDVSARFRRMAGFNVLYTSGFDSFGLPNELAAEAAERHPKDLADEIIQQMRGQFVRLGLSHDTRRIIGNHDEGFYGWIQWVFLKLFELDLAYRVPGPVNWCPSCRITLADSLVTEGACWRCRGRVETRLVKCWLVRESSFANDMLDTLGRLEGWPDKIKKIHVEWIGRQRGVTVRLQGGVEGRPVELTVFVAHACLLPCARAVAVAPEHEILRELAAAGLLSEAEQAAVDQLIRTPSWAARNEKTASDSFASRVLTRIKLLEPTGGAALPLLVCGDLDVRHQHGAILLFPAHVRADAQRVAGLGLDEHPILASTSGTESPFDWQLSWLYVAGTPYAGQSAAEGDRLLTAELARLEVGAQATCFRLRDWNIARQRYWGPPIPIVHCGACGMVPVPENQLPVLLPLDVDFKAGGNPLETHPTFKQTNCPRCARPAQRDTDTLETYSSPWWYHWNCKGTRTESPFDQAEARLYMPVDLMVGGEDQARTCFFHVRMMARALHAAGVVEHTEPIDTLLAIGMVRMDGRKMSKTEGNTVDPSDMISRYGADALRFAVLAAAAPANDLNWHEDLVHNAHLFLTNVWDYARTPGLRECQQDWEAFVGLPPIGNPWLARPVAAAVTRVTRALEQHQYHQATLNLKKLFDRIRNTPGGSDGLSKGSVLADQAAAFNVFLRLLAPLCPHIAEELWAQLRGRQMIMQARWPGPVVARVVRNPVHSTV